MPQLVVNADTVNDTKSSMLALLAIYDTHRKDKDPMGAARIAKMVTNVPREAIIVHWLNLSLPSEKTLLNWIKKDKWPLWHTASTAIRRQCMLNGIDIPFAQFKVHELGVYPYPFSTEMELDVRQIEWLKTYMKKPEVLTSQIEGREFLCR